MNKTNIYQSVKFLLVILGTYWAVKNLLYFIEVWRSLHMQGISTFYLVVSTLAGFQVLIPILFMAPYLALFFINPEDKISKIFLKSIGYSILGIFASEGLILLWFIFITWIHGLLT